MLTDLRVRDLGVIEDLALTFGPGMTALTGETGAGKTLVVEALQLLLGGRANPGMVRAGATEALVEARFVLDADAKEHEVILARSVPAEGRSKAWVDGRMAPVGALGEAAAELAEIHGQHEHRALVTPAAQRNVLDAFAGTDLSVVRALQAELRALADALAVLGGDEQQRAREADVLRYQVHEIQVARLADADEEAGLRAEEDRLADAAAYREAALGAAELLDPADGEGGAAGLLGEAVAALNGRDAFEDFRARVAAAGVEFADVAHALRGEAEAAAQALAERDTGPAFGFRGPEQQLADAWAAHAAGRPAVAARLFRDAAAHAASTGHRTAEAWLLHDLMRTSGVDTSARLRDLARACDSPLVSARARHAGARARDAQELAGAAGDFEALGAMLLAAEAASAAAEAFSRAGHRRAAAAALRRAKALAASCEGATTPGLCYAAVPLSGRERQIAMLAVKGMASKDIAERLFLSVRTVSNHLQHAYTKLGVASRAGLAEALGSS